MTKPYEESYNSRNDIKYTLIVWILLFFVSFHLSEAYGKVLNSFNCYVCNYILYVYVLNYWLKKITMAFTLSSHLFTKQGSYIEM